MILVLVPPIDRVKEYGTGWREYGHYLFDKVAPAVRSRYGGSDLAINTYIGGSSMGGLIALRLAEEFPNKVAGGVQSQSGAFVDMAPGQNFQDTITSTKLKKIAPTTKLWFCCGSYEQDLTKANQTATARLRAMHRPFASMVTPEGHNWTAWRGRMADALTYLLKR